MSWQKPARIGAALVGLLSAAGVYFAMGERRVPPPAAEIPTRDPAATVEISGGGMKNFPTLNKDFEVRFDLMTFYEDGRKRLTGTPEMPVTILVHKGENRTFTIAGTEVRVSQDERQFEVFGNPLRIEDSDGFWLETATATANMNSSMSRGPGAATFGKGRMTGSGTGFTYDSTTEVLTIAEQARVRTVDEQGKVVTDLASTTLVLDRLQHLLTLDTGVHVLRDEQVIDTDHAIGHLSAENDIVTGIDLRGNARVTGGPSIESMHARDITLDYTDDGTALEAAKLIGGATIAMKTMAGAPGRRIHGEVVDITLAPDNTLTSAVARENVRLDLPAAGDTPRRSILARTLDGAGQAGKGLTQALFTGGVTFTEESLRPKGGAADKPSGMRSARSQRLEASLADDTVTSATFTGEVSFEETGLKACAAKADYDPQKGTLALSGATASGPPMAAEEQVAIEGETINVGLDNRKMSARGGVRTFMHAPEGQRCKPSAQRDRSEQGASQMPRLLKADAPVRISAASLEYDGDKGYADYFGGRVRLDQESTQIGADRLVLDQTKGDLVATGNVVSSLPLDDKSNRGQADEMRYSDERRLLTYTSQANAPASIASLTSGPGSILRARTIVLTLAPKENALQTMRAERNVFVTEGPQTVTGGTRLDYTAADELFVITGDGSKPVVAIKRDGGQCRETSGNDVRFQKGKDAVSVTGGKSGNANTRPAKDVACTTPPAR